MKKLENLRKARIDPYPAESFRSHKISEALEKFEEFLNSQEELTLAGRLMSLREHGGSTFADLKDESGKIQLFFKKDLLGEKEYSFFLENFDIGDFIETKGVLIKTKVGEQTLEVKSFRILSKTLLPLPEKWHGLQDIEERFRKRYLDLLLNEEVRNKFQQRFEIIQKVRQYFLNSGCLEVETPILQTIPGGALAKPFKTHLNILDLDLYLRVAPELFLKRLLVGGFEKVFEIGRNFRNEGIDREHNPEFTMLEAYFAYKDYNWLMDFTEDLFIYLNGNFKKPFKRIEFHQLVKGKTGLEADELFKKEIRPGIIDPTFVINHPIELSPLAKRIGDKNVARFQLIAGGFELCNAFSELNDPLDQKERLEEQSKLKGEEVHPYDKEFLEALEYGMPPAAGIGIGIDRLVMFLTGAANLKEVILFPTMKPKDA